MLLHRSCAYLMLTWFWMSTWTTLITTRLYAVDRLDMEEIMVFLRALEEGGREDGSGYSPAKMCSLSPSPVGECGAAMAGKIGDDASSPRR